MKLFSASVAPLSLTSVCGFLLFLLLFFVVLFSTTLLSYQSAFTLTTLFLTFFYFCNLRHYLQFLPFLFVHFLHTAFILWVLPFSSLYRRNRYRIGCPQKVRLWGTLFCTGFPLYIHIIVLVSITSYYCYVSCGTIYCSFIFSI